MSKAKHTPGKWEISSRSEYTVVQSGLNRSIATTGGYSDNQRSESVEIENKANARLIAEAPSMYQLLKRVVNEIDWSYETWHGHGGQEFRDEIDEIIKKIEG